MTPRALVVGGGAIARRAHIPAWRALERRREVVLGAVVEPDPSAAAELEREFRVPVHSTVAGALDADRYDLLDLCTPSFLHGEGLRAAFERGIPALVEKPLLTTAEQVSDLAAALDQRPAAAVPFVSVVQNYRYYSSVERACARLRGGFIGRLTSITAFAPSRFPITWTRSTWLYEHGGVLQDFAPHAIDLIVFFADSPLVRVSAFARDISDGNMSFANYCQVLFEFESGVLATLDASWVTGTNMFCVGLHGTGGHIDLDARLDYFREYHGTYTPFDDAREFAGRMRATLRRVAAGEYFRGPLVFYARLLRDVLTSIRTKSPASPGVATLAQGMNASVALTCALASAAQGRTVTVAEIVGDHSVRVLRRLYHL